MVDQFAQHAIAENTELLIYLVQDQLSEGLIGEKPYKAPKYEPETAEQAYLERARNQNKTGRYNFEWHGYFYDSMYVKSTKNDFEIKSDPSTTSGLLGLSKMKSRFTHDQLTQLSEKTEQDFVEKQVEPEIYKEIDLALARILNY